MDRFSRTWAALGRNANFMSEKDEVIEIDALLVNPFKGMTPFQMDAAIEEFMQDTDIDESWLDHIRRGAYLAQDPKAFSSARSDNLKLKREEEVALARENAKNNSKWHQPALMYSLIICCSMAAATQGWDETAVNQAQVYYPAKLQLSGEVLDTEPGRYGLVNAAPYLGCAVLGCWLTEPLNRYFGRRGTIFISCAISSLTCLWQALTNSWWHLFIARFALGLGIGPKGATVPIFASECAPKQIRGALVMQWQMWTAFGIMLGYVAGVIFGSAIEPGSEDDLRWRLIIGSPMILPLFVCLYVYVLPESPRWLLQKARRTGNKKYYQKALRSLERLRTTKLEAARDIFLINAQLCGEDNIKQSHNRFIELFTKPRNRRALTASAILMFFQQQCGVNVLAFYSSIIFERAGFEAEKATRLSMGFGILNFLFAIPAIFLIDTFGRRNLLLATFPFMSMFQLVTGFSFLAPTESMARRTLVSFGMYMFAIAYSPGLGPVPFLYGSESMPLYVRELGMSLVTAILWILNFMLAITFPSFLKAFKPLGTFCWYAAWCLVGFLAILFFVYETKDQTLEELDARFSVPITNHARYGWRQLKYVAKRSTGRKATKPELDMSLVVFAERGVVSRPTHRPRRTVPIQDDLEKLAPQTVRVSPAQEE